MSSAPANVRRRPTSPQSLLLATLTIVVATSATAWLVGVASAQDNSPWFQGLSQAPGAPTGIAYAILWPSVFSTMSMAGVLVWNAAGSWKAADSALGVYLLQLCACAGWSALFFVLKHPLGALVTLVVLWLLVLVMIGEFQRHSHLASQLLYVYLGWISYALYLNVWIVFAN